MLRGFFDRPTFGGENGSGDPVAEIAARGAIAETRERNERYIEVIVLIATGAGVLSILARMFTLEMRAGTSILMLTVLVCAYYLVSLLRRRNGPFPSTRAQRWGRTTLEVTAATAVTLVNVKVSAEFALTSGAHYTYFLAIAVATLRLDPSVSAYGSALAVIQHLALYLVLIWQFDLSPEILSVHPGVFAFRLAAMALTGMVGFVLSRTLREQTMKIATETLERERVRAAFGSYVDDRVVERVLSGALSTGPERRTITVLFLDIRSFTAFAEERDAVVVFASLQKALGAFSSEIQRQGGIVNKFLGDGLLALFGAPEPQADHPRRAVRAALDIVAEARRLSASGAFPGLAVGVGIHTGEAMIGNLGEARREYTAIGDVVNVASRVEALNKDLGTVVLVTDAVRAALGSDAEVRSFPAVVIRGRKEPIDLFEVQRVPVTGGHEAVADPSAAPVGRVRTG